MTEPDEQFDNWNLEFNEEETDGNVNIITNESFIPNTININNVPINLMFPAFVPPTQAVAPQPYTPKDIDLSTELINSSRSITALKTKSRSFVSPILKETENQTNPYILTRLDNEEVPKYRLIPLEPEVSNKDGALVLDDKKCSCDKSHCLKLYCECFKSGRLCQNCACSNCYNNSEFDKKRQLVIKSMLSKNKDAFKPRVNVHAHVNTITKRRQPKQHRNGCRCSRSGCLKKYCECFQNKVLCGESCRCKQCQNTESGKIERIINPPLSNTEVSQISTSDFNQLFENEKLSTFCSDAVARVTNYKVPAKMAALANTRYKSELSNNENINYNLSDIAAVASEELAKIKSHNVHSKLCENYEILIQQISGVLAAADEDQRTNTEDERIKYILKEYLWCTRTICHFK